MPQNVNTFHSAPPPRFAKNGDCYNTLCDNTEDDYFGNYEKKYTSWPLFTASSFESDLSSGYTFTIYTHFTRLRSKNGLDFGHTCLG